MSHNTTQTRDVLCAVLLDRIEISLPNDTPLICTVDLLVISVSEWITTVRGFDMYRGGDRVNGQLDHAGLVLDISLPGRAVSVHPSSRRHERFACVYPKLWREYEALLQQKEELDKIWREHRSKDPAKHVVLEGYIVRAIEDLLMPVIPTITLHPVGDYVSFLPRHTKSQELLRCLEGVQEGERQLEVADGLPDSVRLAVGSQVEHFRSRYSRIMRGQS